MNQTTTQPQVSAAIEARAETIYQQMHSVIYVRTDKLFAFLMVCQWFFGIGCALVLSPRTWAGASSDIHPHVWAAIFLGGILSLFPAGLALAQPGRMHTRHVVAGAQMLMSALLIHLLGGRIEAHFHVFGSLAFVAFYRDWKVLLTASIVVALDHYLRGAYWPQSVYGIAAVEPWRWVEHTAWVAFEDIFLGYSCVFGVQNLRAIAHRHAILEETNKNIEQLRKSAEDANVAKSAFLANMSHEIRTPLNAILGFTQLIEQPEIDHETRKQYVDIIKRNGGSLARIIDDILDLSKIEAGKLAVEKVEFSLPDLLSDIEQSFAVQAVEREIVLSIECDAGVPRYFLSDPMRIRQILINVIGNAIKFTSRGTVQVIVSNRMEFEKCHLEFRIADSGRGISKTEQAKLFQAFSQADPSTTRAYGGTGLGLALSRNLARKLGGNLELISSEVGKGSTFVLSLNLDPSHKIEAARSKQVDRSTAQALANLDGRLKGVTILVADDAADNRFLLERLLKRAGAEVHLAENGEESMAKAEVRNFDLILMDIQMPIMDGYIATRRLRQSGYNGPIIALTAHAMSDDRDRCIASGCTDYLSKPIDAARLVQQILKHVRPERRRTEPALRPVVLTGTDKSLLN